MTLITETVMAPAQTTVQVIEKPAKAGAPAQVREVVVAKPKRRCISAD
jgi:hypothetical protein